MAEAIKKILLVDDNLVVLATLVMAFTKDGFIALKANSAEGAIAILEKELPDIILSDYEMPGINGFAFRQRLLEKPATKNIPFVFFTSHNDNSLVMEGLDKLLAVDFINKGTPLPVIIAKINNLLATVREKQALYIEELRMAAEAINVKSVPTSCPVLKGFDINFWHKPYQGYPGGDFIDFIRVSDRYLFTVLGDVMGKKWTAWFFTFCFLSYIRAAVRFSITGQDYSPALILEKINRAVCQDEVLNDVLAGLSLLLVDEETGKIAYSGAGDLPLLYYKSATNTLSEVQTTGMVLGIFEGNSYDEQEITMQPGDQLLIFSDGIIDYNEDDGSHKSDYNLFKQNVYPLLQAPESFKQMRSFLQQQLNGSRQADDCSIISILKTNK